MKLLHFFWVMVLLHSGSTIIEDCHDQFPVAHSGMMVDGSPHWQLSAPPCRKNRPFGELSTQMCLKNRTVYVIGNSIARGMLYGLAVMLNNGSQQVSRADQKVKCQKHDINWSSESCKEEFGSTSLRFLHMLYMDGYNYSTRGGFKYITDKSYMTTHETFPDTPGQYSTEINQTEYFSPEDGCTNHISVRHCLQHFFINATRNDVLIFNLGLGYVVPHRSYSPETSGIDTLGWMLDSAAAFKQHLSATFASPWVFRFTMTPMRGNLSHFTSTARDYESHLYKVWSEPRFSRVSSSQDTASARGNSISSSQSNMIERKNYYMQESAPTVSLSLSSVLSSLLASNDHQHHQQGHMRRRADSESFSVSTGSASAAASKQSLSVSSMTPLDPNETNSAVDNHNNSNNDIIVIDTTASSLIKRALSPQQHAVSTNISLWYLVDQFAINDNRLQLYNDAVHFSGVLTSAFLQQVLNIVCWNQGDKTYARGASTDHIISKPCPHCSKPKIISTSDRQQHKTR